MPSSSGAAVQTDASRGRFEPYSQHLLGADDEHVSVGGPDGEMRLDEGQARAFVAAREAVRASGRPVAFETEAGRVRMVPMPDGGVHVLFPGPPADEPEANIDDLLDATPADWDRMAAPEGAPSSSPGRPPVPMRALEELSDGAVSVSEPDVSVDEEDAERILAACGSVGTDGRPRSLDVDGEAWTVEPRPDGGVHVVAPPRPEDERRSGDPEHGTREHQQEHQRGRRRRRRGYGRRHGRHRRHHGRHRRNPWVEQFLGTSMRVRGGGAIDELVDELLDWLESPAGLVDWR